ncbi:YeeE/YedE family protein [Proteiniborus sp.]|uniref:YeeE/YedE family protein n=1 Tax=Proteiniborus sp. TaxID=2079015 RepID=UPI00333012A6
MQTTGKINKNQLIIALFIIILIAILGKLLSGTSSKLGLYLITGVVLGYILTRSRFGFAGGIKRIYVTGEGSLTKALLIMFAVTMVASAGIQWAAVAKGAVPQFRAATSDLVIPGSASVQILNISTILGGFFFGVGMILAGGCASGTLSDLGEGEIRSAIALPFFVLFTIPGHALRHTIADSAIGKIGAQVYLPDVFGFIGTLIISFALLLVLYVITRKYEDLRKKEGFYEETVFEPNELPLPEDEDFKLFSYKTYHKFFIERWSFFKGGMLLSIGFIFVLNTTGKNWGVTSTFTKWAVGLIQGLGIEITSPAFASIVKDVNAGLLNDGGTLRNIGIVIGAAICLLLAGKFRFNFDFRLKDTIFYALGGAFMGFGSRLAGGCNLGALYSAISSFSLSGWGFLIALSLGGIVALKLFEGKINIIPPNRHKKASTTL